MLSATGSNADVFAITGAGSSLCSLYNTLKNKNADRADDIYFSRASGFVSAMNMSYLAQGQSKIRDLNGITQDQQRAAIDRYCNAHPDDKFMDAVVAAYREFPVVDYQP